MLIRNEIIKKNNSWICGLTTVHTSTLEVGENIHQKRCFLFLLMLKIASRSYDVYGDVSFLNEFKQNMCFPVCNESGDRY